MKSALRTDNNGERKQGGVRWMEQDLVNPLLPA